MRFGYWMPVFGGWLRNVADEGMPATWDYVSRLAQRSEQIGYDLSLVAELNLNDIKGPHAPALDAWSTAAALMAVTKRLELMVAVRPTFHAPALFAKTAATIDRIGGARRLSLNVVSSWWSDEAKRYGITFEQHDDRYARTSEWLDVVQGAWTQDEFSYAGRYYTIDGCIVEPKPQALPFVYAGGESEAAKNLIAAKCDAYVMHGDAPERIAEKIADMSERRARLGLPRMQFGIAAFAIVRETAEAAQRERERIINVRADAAGFANYQQWLAGTQLDSTMSVEEYSVSNRGLRSGLIGDRDTVGAQVERFTAAGVDLLLVQFSPQYEEMERFAEAVIAPQKKMATVV